MIKRWGNLSGWKLSTIVLGAVPFGFILAQLAGLGLATAQSDAVAKVQPDTSNCGYGVNYGHFLPPGSFVVQVVNDSSGGQMYAYDVCK